MKVKPLCLQIAAVTTAVCALCAVFPTAAFADNKAGELQSSASSAREEYEAASGALSDLKDQKDQTENEVNALQDQTTTVSNQLSAVYTQLENAQTKLDAAQAAADDAAQALSDKQEEYNAKYQNYKEQLAAMQQLHDGGNIAFLSQATNLYELLTFSEVLAEMGTANDSALDDLNAEAADLADKKQAAENTAAELQAAKDTLAEQQTQLSATKDQLAGALQQADAALSAQDAALQAQALITEEAKKAMDAADAELEAYVRSQSSLYTTELLHCSLDFRCPLDSYKRLTTQFGQVDGYGRSGHRGQDFSAASGTPIHAVADGIVSVAATHWSWGNYVQVSHGRADNGNTYDTLYAHMTSYCVSRGQLVTKGDVIGYVGSTGESTGPHLHLEFYQNGSLINPLTYIPVS